MKSKVTQAQAVIARMNGLFDRAAVIQWLRIRDQAVGREKERVSRMSEAFYPMLQNEMDARWLGMILSGVPALVGEAMADAPAAGSGT